MKKISYTNIQNQWIDEKKKILRIIESVFKKGQFVNEKEVKVFEKNVAKVCGVKYAIGLNSGTDALTLGLKLIGVKRVMKLLRHQTLLFHQLVA